MRLVHARLEMVAEASCGTLHDVEPVNNCQDNQSSAIGADQARRDDVISGNHCLFIRMLVQDTVTILSNAALPPRALAAGISAALRASVSSSPYLEESCPAMHAECAVEALVSDRMQCIRPAVISQVRAGLDSGVDQHSPCTTTIGGAAKLKRDYALHHGFHKPQLVSQLSCRAMKKTQRHGARSRKQVIILEKLIEFDGLVNASDDDAQPLQRQVLTDPFLLSDPWKAKHNSPLIAVSADTSGLCETSNTLWQKWRPRDLHAGASDGNSDVNVDAPSWGALAVDRDGNSEVNVDVAHCSGGEVQADREPVEAVAQAAAAFERNSCDALSPSACDKKEHKEEEKPKMLTVEECASMSPRTFGAMPFDRIPAEVALRYLRDALGLEKEDAKNR